MNFPSVVLALGKPGSGKSYLIRSLVYKLAKAGLCNFISVFSGTSFNEFFQSFLPEESIHCGLDTRILRNHLVLAAKNKVPNVIIFDDIAGSVSWKNKIVMQLLNNYRHYNCTVIIASQTPQNIITPSVKQVTKYSFVFAQHDLRSISNIWESFAIADMSRDQFTKKLKDFTREKHYCLSLDMTKSEENDKYKKFKAPSVEKFRISY